VTAATFAIAATKPLWQLESLGRAVSAAAHATIQRGETSFCGIELSAEMRNAIAASGGAENTSIAIFSTDDRPLAAVPLSSESGVP
jgi:hypothetical protein